jgi:hypothetical protein
MFVVNACVCVLKSTIMDTRHSLGNIIFDTVDTLDT